MKNSGKRWYVAVLLWTLPADGTGAQLKQLEAPRTVELKAVDGTLLRATYFSAGKPGPGVMLFHQSNRNRKAWEEAAGGLAAGGIHVLSIDERGYGESGGNKKDREQFHDSDLDAAFEFLGSQTGVQGEALGVAGAGWLGVDDAVELARRHAREVKSLVAISGETLLPQLRYLRQAWQLPGLFVVSEDDEYPPTVEAMEWLYDCSASAQKQFIHYAGAKAPWVWYETSDASKVPATGSHGTDLFQRHPELRATIVDWFVSTLIRGQRPADAVASAAILQEIERPGGPERVTEQLLVARRRAPTRQLWPEVNVDILGEDHMREAEAQKKAGHARQAQAEMKVGIEIFKLNLLAYPGSADAQYNLADAYLQAGKKGLARLHAEKSLRMIDAHITPLSSWSDSAERRAEIRGAVEQLVKKLVAMPAPAAGTSR
jgi:pimeloyl-ACP methyl ester carboxylesterase